ncbi:MAG: hypothetical protein ABW224_09300 [Kibdelosporangium sp.]
MGTDVVAGSRGGTAGMSIHPAPSCARLLRGVRTTDKGVVTGPNGRLRSGDEPVDFGAGVEVDAAGCCGVPAAGCL